VTDKQAAFIKDNHLEAFSQTSVFDVSYPDSPDLCFEQKTGYL
jgi:hypothetical protein